MKINEEYLWDRSGEPDAEIVQLERLLSRFRQRPAAPRVRRWWFIAAAAALLIGTGVLLRIQSSDAATSWRLSVNGGTAGAVRAGQVIETGPHTKGRMESESVGQVDIASNSRVRFVAARNSQQRLALDRGTIHAFIWAPPAEFVVDTPSAKTVDLGCEYTLSVAKNGQGVLTVELGWVAFEWHSLESFIPAGAACTTRPDHGPGTPHFLDAPPAFVAAIERFDASGDAEALNAALPMARTRDGLTLWHLLARTSGTERSRVLERFTQLVQLPAGVTKEAVLAGDAPAMDGAWNALALGETRWWREWKRGW